MTAPALDTLQHSSARLQLNTLTIKVDKKKLPADYIVFPRTFPSEESSKFSRREKSKNPGAFFNIDDAAGSQRSNYLIRRKQRAKAVRYGPQSIADLVYKSYNSSGLDRSNKPVPKCRSFRWLPTPLPFCVCVFTQNSTTTTSSDACSSWGKKKIEEEEEPQGAG